MTGKRSLCTRTCDKFIGKPAPTPRGQLREGRTCSGLGSQSLASQWSSSALECQRMWPVFSAVQCCCVLFVITLFLVQRTSLFLLMFPFIFRNTFRVASASESFYLSVSVLSRVGTGSKRTGFGFIRRRIGICLKEIVWKYQLVPIF